MDIVLASHRCAICLCPKYLCFHKWKCICARRVKHFSAVTSRVEVVHIHFENKWREIIGSASLLRAHLITLKLLDVLPSELVYRWAKTNLLLSSNRFPWMVRCVQGLIWAKKALCCLSLNASLQQLIHNTALWTWWTPAESNSWSSCRFMKDEYF